MPSIRITRTPSPDAGGDNGASSAPPTSTTSGTSGKEYQKIATSFKRSGDRVNAAANFRKAIEAYRAEAARPGGGFEAQQGMRSCELELRLLGERE